MEVNLYRLSRISWAVQLEGSEAEVFSSIEGAADKLMNIGVKDGAIDEALIELDANNHTRAIFDSNGDLKSTDGAKHNGLLGVA